MEVDSTLTFSETKCKEAMFFQVLCVLDVLTESKHPKHTKPDCLILDRRLHFVYFVYFVYFVFTL